MRTCHGPRGIIEQLETKQCKTYADGKVHVHGTVVIPLSPCALVLVADNSWQQQHQIDHKIVAHTDGGLVYAAKGLTQTGQEIEVAQAQLFPILPVLKEYRKQIHRPEHQKQGL